MDRDEREALAERILRLVPSTDTQIVVRTEDRALTRFTHETIHQHLGSASVEVRVCLREGGRLGVATTSETNDEGLRDVVERARRLMRHASSGSLAQAPPAAQRMSPVPDSGRAFVAATHATSAEQRAKIADALFRVVEAAGLWVAGYVSTGTRGITILESDGAPRSHDTTEAALTAKVNGLHASGYAEQISCDIGDIDGARCGSEAIAKVAGGENLRSVEPGSWTVILEPVAFAELLAYFVDHFSAKAVDEGNGCITREHLNGAPIVDRSLSISDDWEHPLAPGCPFDAEGTPRRRCDLIERGVARTLLTDRLWSARLGLANTGHALPPPSEEGPQPCNIVVAPGDASLEALIAGTERGLLISRLWYLRPVDRRRNLITGMTRDGTFLIEDGRLVGGVHNLRFNQSVVNALGEVTLGDRLARTVGLAGGMVVPAAKLEHFSFTSSTSF